MTKEETIKVIDKIKIYRPKFEVTTNVIEEYFKVFEPYDYEDIEKKLNEYLSDLTNQGKYPDPIYLTKYLRTKYQKEHTKEPYIICDLCLRSIKHLEYKQHRERCSSALYLCENGQKYFNKTFSYLKLMQMENKAFDELYFAFCNKLYDVIEEGIQKKCLENYIRSYQGLEIRYSYDEIMEGA